jgi:hypothetical protein
MSKKKLYVVCIVEKIVSNLFIVSFFVYVTGTC